MNGNGSITIEGLTTLLPGAVLLPIPRREKAPRGFDAKDWQNTTFEETQRHHYQARLRQAENTGVLLGQPSGSLCAIDIDDDELIQGFLDLNPNFAKTLCSKGQRGCQFWVIIEGDYPHQVAKLKHPDGRTYGEWRADGGQSVIRGIHPEGMHYQLLCDSPPVRIRFNQIRWPLDWVLPWKNPPPITELPTVVAPAPSAEISDRVRAYLDKVDPAISGQDGHGKTFWAACILVWGFAMDQEQACSNMRPTLVQDTREQRPLIFTRLPVVIGTLYSGDISIQGLEDLFSIERKGSIEELVSCTTGQRERFVHELHRLRGFRFKRLVVIGSRAEIELQRYRNRVAPAVVLSTLTAWEIRFDLPTVFFSSPEEAALQIERWAFYFARQIVRDANNLLRGCRDSTLSQQHNT